MRITDDAEQLTVSLPADHPFIMNDFYSSIRWWLVGAGAAVVALSLALLLSRHRPRPS